MTKFGGHNFESNDAKANEKHGPSFPVFTMETPYRHVISNVMGCNVDDSGLSDATAGVKGSEPRIAR